MAVNQESFGQMTGPIWAERRQTNTEILKEIDKRDLLLKAGYDDSGWRDASLPKGAAADWLKQQKAGWENALQTSGVKANELKPGQYFGEYGIFDANTKNSLPPDYTAVGYSKGVLRNPYVESLPTNNVGDDRDTIYSQTKGQHYAYRQGYQKLGPQSDLIIARRTGSFSAPDATPKAPTEFKPSPALEQARAEARNRGNAYLGNQGGSNAAGGSIQVEQPKPIQYTGDLYKDAALISANAAQYTPRFQDFVGGLMRNARVAALEVGEGNNFLAQKLGADKRLQPSQPRDPFTDPITINPNSLYALTRKDIKSASS